MSRERATHATLTFSATSFYQHATAEADRAIADGVNAAMMKERKTTRGKARGW